MVPVSPGLVGSISLVWQPTLERETLISALQMYTIMGKASGVKPKEIWT